MTRSGVEGGSNGFDLHQLVVIARQGHAHEGAGGIAVSEGVAGDGYLPTRLAN